MTYVFLTGDAVSGVGIKVKLAGLFGLNGRRLENAESLKDYVTVKFSDSLRMFHSINDCYS